MLIRSQNRIALTNIDNVGTIYISGYHKDGENYRQSYADDDNIWIVRTGDFSLGEYSSKEKAIKVLDMIQQKYGMHYYGPGGQMATSNECVPPFGFIPPKVFQMPQDSEVEV